MRKLWYAGAAVASGLILFAASPARADDQPSTPQLLPGNSVAPPFGDLLSGAGGYALNSVRGAGSTAMSGASTATASAGQEAKNGLDRVRRPTNNLHVTVPLDGSRPLTRVRPGTNSPAVLPRSARELPPAGVTGPLLPQSSVNDSDGLLGGMPLLGGLLPNGQLQPAFDPAFDASSLDRPTMGETESLPMLGGLLPDPSVPNVSGLPAGGMAVLAPAVSGHHRAKPATDPSSTDPSAPSVSTPAAADSSAPVDPRLNEEPIDPSERTFSPDTRPVAGVDQQYK